MTAKIIAEVIQKLTTTRFVSEIIIIILEHLAKLSDSKVDDKLVQVCREALLTEEKPS